MKAQGFKTIARTGGRLLEAVVMVMAAVLVLFVGAMAFLPRFDYHLLIIRSGSMEPTIKTGSAAVIRREDRYTVGDIITFVEKDRGLVTHRIVKEENGVFLTQGDANNAEDMDPVPAKNIRGKVVFSLPYAGYVIAFLQTKVGMVLFILVPAGYFIGSELWKVWSMWRKRKGKQGSTGVQGAKEEA